MTADGWELVAGFFNPHTLIAGRMLSANPGHRRHDRTYILRKARFAAALGLLGASGLYDAPYYRLRMPKRTGCPPSWPTGSVTCWRCN